MYQNLICAILVCAAPGLIQAADDTNTEKQKIREAIIAWRAGMLSDDEAVRLRTFDAAAPTLEDMKALLEDDAELIWPQMKMGLDMMRKNTDKIRAEMLRRGKLLEVEPVNVRSDPATKHYDAIFAIIPKTVPVYRARIKYENGTAGTSTYLLLDGKFKFIRGLEVIPEVLERIKAEGK